METKAYIKVCILHAKKIAKKISMYELPVFTAYLTRPYFPPNTTDTNIKDWTARL